MYIVCWYLLIPQEFVEILVIFLLSAISIIIIIIIESEIM